ncbi:hypothetical protein ACR820_34205 [Streptomyces netropsis]
MFIVRAEHVAGQDEGRSAADAVAEAVADGPPGDGGVYTEPLGAPRPDRSRAVRERGLPGTPLVLRQGRPRLPALHRRPGVLSPALALLGEGGAPAPGIQQLGSGLL